LSDIYHILSTTSHRAKATQDFFKNVVPALISAKECPTHSPDMKPLDSDWVWDILQELVYEGWRESYANLHELRKHQHKNGTRSMTNNKSSFCSGNGIWQQSQKRMGQIQHIFS